MKIRILANYFHRRTTVRPVVILEMRQIASIPSSIFNFERVYLTQILILSATTNEHGYMVSILSYIRECSILKRMQGHGIIYFIPV